MFIGHFALGFAAKRAAPRVSLGMLFAAVAWADLVWPVLLATGIEQVIIEPGNTAVTPLNFVSYPYSHSLLTLGLWGVLLGFLYRAATGRNGNTIALLDPACRQPLGARFCDAQARHAVVSRRAKARSGFVEFSDRNRAPRSRDVRAGRLGLHAGNPAARRYRTLVRHLARARSCRLPTSPIWSAVRRPQSRSSGSARSSRQRCC